MRTEEQMAEGKSEFFDKLKEQAASEGGVVIVNDHKASRVYCPRCQGIHQQQPVGVVGGTQTDGCDVDFTTWLCAGCNREWSGELYETAPPADCA